MSRSQLRANSPSLLLIGLVVVFAWLPVIGGLRSVFHWDLFYEHVPFRAFIAPMMARGELPLWAPGIRSGYPLHANGEAAIFSPVELPLRMMLAPHRAVDGTMVVSSLLAAGFTLAFLRSLGASREAAAFAGVAYGLSGRLVAAVWPNAAVVAALLPALFLGVERIRQRPAAINPALGLALVIGAALLAGRPQSLAVTAPFVLAQALVGLVGHVRSRTALASRYACSLTIAALLGIALGAPQMLSTLALARASQRGEGLTLNERAWPPLASPDMPLVFLPIGGRDRWPEARAHVGVLTLTLAIVGVWYARSRPKGGSSAYRMVFLAAIGCAVVAFILALGTRTPLFGLLTSLPLLRGLRVPARFLIPYAFALTVAAGLAFDRLFATSTRRLKWMVLAGLGAEMIASAWLTIPWASPAVYSTLPRAVASLRRLPLDESGAVPRYLALEETYLPLRLLTRADGPALQRTVEHLDAVNGDRALLFDLSDASGYGEPVPVWQSEFLEQLTPARRRALGVAAVISGAVDGQGESRSLLTVTPVDDALPRALLVARARHVGSAAEGREALDGAADPAAVVFLEDGDAIRAPQGDFPSQPARVASATATTVEIEVDAPAAGWLVVFDAWDPGWRATVAGTAATVYRADGFFRAVAVPRGRSRVQLTYRPTEFVVGALCAAIAALTMLALWWRAPR